MSFWLVNWLRMLFEQQEADEDPPVDTPDPEATPEPPGIVNVGAWCGLASLRNADRDIGFARAHGINRLDVIVNDHSTAREPRRFDTYETALIEQFCKKAQAAYIETHLMSWIMPHADYIDEAAEQLIPLAKRCNAASVQWDAEEPWTLARDRLRYEAAASRISSAFKELHCPMGVNGIGYTPTDKFGPIARACDYLVPQCYSTSSSGQKPEDVVPKFVRRYRERFCKAAFTPPDKPAKSIVVGLAAYRQSKIPNHTIESAMHAALGGAQALEGIDTVIYWSLRHIRSSKRIARIISSIRRPGVA